MQRIQNVGRRSQNQRGMTLFMVAACLVVLLGVSALAIDLAYLYVTRSEAQRAADSAALAAAQKLVESGLLNGTLGNAAAEALARQQAKDIGLQNLVGGQGAVIADNDVVFTYPDPNNPNVSVRVRRAAGVAGNPGPMPTFFAKAIGFDTVDVVAVATAEAYTETPGGPTVCVGCLKPWMLPNCDPNPAHLNTDPNPVLAALHCGPPNGALGTPRFIDESGDIINFGAAPAGVVGQQMVVKPGAPSAAPAPGQYYPIQIPPGTDPAVCPACSSDKPTGGGSLYRWNIACCNTNRFYCGQQVLVDEKTGNMQGPTAQGVQCLIHQENGYTFNNGQDYIQNPSVFPLTYIGGTNHPDAAFQGQPMPMSEALVTLPVYDGHQLTPGESGGTQFITIIGFIQLFIEVVATSDGNGLQKGDVISRVVHVSGCGGGGGGGVNCGGPGTIGTGGSPVPVRLIQTQSNLTFPPPSGP